MTVLKMLTFRASITSPIYICFFVCASWIKMYKEHNLKTLYTSKFKTANTLDGFSTKIWVLEQKYLTLLTSEYNIFNVYIGALVGGSGKQLVLHTC